MLPRLILVLPFAWLMLASGPANGGESGEFADLVKALDVGLNQKAEAVNKLAGSDNPRVNAVMDAMLNGKLYRHKKDAGIVIVTGESDDKNFEVSDAISGEILGTAGKREIKRISVNNQLRSLLRALLAKRSLSDPDANIRLAAVQRIAEGGGEEAIDLLQQVLTSETDARIRNEIETGIALAELSAPNAEIRIAAIRRLENNNSQQARILLTQLLANEQNEIVREAAQKALASIEARTKIYQFAETAVFGLSLGSVLFLAAIGLAITFGVMGVINMAHGELIMLGAYTTYIIQLLLPEHLNISLILAIPAAFLVSALFGVIIERSVIRYLYGRPLETLLATFGISLILQQLVRTGISAQNVPVANPDWMSGFWQINEALSITYNRLYIFVFALVVFAALLLVLKKTRLGLQVRAVSQNRTMARAMGIRTGWVDAMTFALGAGIAGVAGVALSQLTNVGPNLGQAYIVDSFMVVVFGGVGNLWGALLGALSLGVANKFLEPLAGAVLAKVLVLVFIILFIQKRPRGLFPQKGRAAEH